ncbi:hypothetical protein B6E66_24680 [Streptomyces maremycinicus]|nr:hypothetical protein B6E66_24680 [Streptomyces sp. B9173]
MGFSAGEMEFSAQEMEFSAGEMEFPRGKSESESGLGHGSMVDGRFSFSGRRRAVREAQAVAHGQRRPEVDCCAVGPDRAASALPGVPGLLHDHPPPGGGAIGVDTHLSPRGRARPDVSVPSSTRGRTPGSSAGCALFAGPATAVA